MQLVSAMPLTATVDSINGLRGYAWCGQPVAKTRKTNYLRIPGRQEKMS